MRLKKQVMEALQQEITGRLKPGDELVVIGAVALEGTRLLAKDKKTMLEMRFSQGFIQDMLYARERYVCPGFNRKWLCVENGRGSRGRCDLSYG